MTDQLREVVVTGLITTMIFWVITIIALCVNADTLVKAYTRWRDWRAKRGFDE